MRGLELQGHLAANGFQVPVIFVMADKDGQMAQALRGGALAFLRKPFEDEDLFLVSVPEGWRMPIGRELLLASQTWKHCRRGREPGKALWS
jgi:CheY-like chemotaxis protein